MAYTKTNWQDLPDTTTPVNATNLNHIENGIKDNDDKLLGNAQAGDFKPESVSWKEEGYGDKFQIIPDFGGTDDSNMLKIRGAVGGQGTDPSLYDLETISGKSGNKWVKGYMHAPNGFFSRETGSVGTAVGNGKLIIKKANNTEAPNNGVVLEFGNSANFTGQLYIGDNSTQGCYFNGWSNGTRGTWKKLVFLEDVVESGGNANGYYTKYGDGTLICRYFVGPITTNAGAGTTTAVTFPYAFVDTNWTGTLTMTNGQAYWSYVFTNVGDKSKTGFNLKTWNNGVGTNSGQYFDYIAIGRWK